MFSIKALPEFTGWLDSVADGAVWAVVAARLKFLERGLMGDVEPAGESASELRSEIAPPAGASSTTLR